MSELGLHWSPPSKFGLINARDQKYNSTMEAIGVKKISDYERQKRRYFWYSALRGQ